MAQMIIRANNRANYGIDHMMEAFRDILEATGAEIFTDIKLIELNEAPALIYKAYGNEIIKEFNADQGAPELKADIMEHLFSMLDAAANL